MARSDDKLEREKPEATGLESYRRLIKLQKEMIELSQQHERSRRECDALREVVAREVSARRKPAARLLAGAARFFCRAPLALARNFFSCP